MGKIKKPVRLRQQRPSTKDWRNKAAAELYRILKSGKPVPTGAELAQFCENELDYCPDLADVCRLINGRLDRLIG
jgi:hypothetical protein